MPPKIENTAGVLLNEVSCRVLQNLFGDYQKLIIQKEFGGGLSGGRVLKVLPIRTDNTPELPTVVKLAPVVLVEQEWQAYRTHMQNRLPRISPVTARPVLMHKLGWGGLRYGMVGEGEFEVLSLRDYLCQPETTVDEVREVVRLLLRIMRHIWSHYELSEAETRSSSYDQVLPVNLLVRPTSLPAEQATNSQARLVTPSTFLPDQLTLGDRVRLHGFVVHKANYDTRTVTLRSPPHTHLPAGSQNGNKQANNGTPHPEQAQPVPTYFMRVRFPAQATELPSTNNLPPAWLEGEVEESRMSRLYAEVRCAFGQKLDPTLPIVPLGEQIFLPNPLEALPRLLGQPRAMNIATIHGDFNLENILIEPETNTVSLIDFADARKDHVLHDLLRLETDMTTRLLPTALAQEQLPLLPTLTELYWRLHVATLSGITNQPAYPSSALQKLWEMLYAIRRAARSYCVDANDLSEYYQGLVIYLLGALKFKNLSRLPEAPLPKQIAFWGATLINAALDAPPSAPGPGDAITHYLAMLLTQLHAAPAEPSQSDEANAALPPAISKLAAAQARLAALPTERVATLGALPAPARMPYNRNPLFVGRGELLQQLAHHFQAQTTHADSQPAPVAIIAGLGGMGKTQLATEFVHRYGRFFAGGVFWLSMADARAVPAEIAACGRADVLNLRPDFDALALEEQGRLVQATWQEPLPRLLVFDNCEEPALLAKYRPTSGGCCVLVTSRRDEWGEVPNAAALTILPLEALARADSLALLREHRAEVDQPLLEEIAAEVGDLPLALHLAGSYLGRYRSRLVAQEYLRQLRASVSLEHPSLQSGGLSPTDHEQNVERTIALSFNQLDRADFSDVVGLAILTRAALLAPGEPIPLDLLGLLIPAQLLAPAAGLATAYDPAQLLSEPISRLAELGLARLDANANLRLHRLVILYLQKALASEIAQARPGTEEQLCQEAERLNNAGYPTALLRWQVHLRAVVSQAFARNDELAAHICQALGEHFRQVGEYERAKVAIRRVLEISQQLAGEQSAPTAKALTALGYILFLQDDLSAAKTHYENALTIQDALLGDHLETADTLNHLGLLHQTMGRLRAAQRCHRRALRIRLRWLGENHPLVAHSLCNLAYLDYIGKKYASARTHLEQALTIQSKNFGEHHPETVRVLHNLGELQRDQGDLSAAQETFAKVLVLQQQVLAANHPENARALVNLGYIAREGKKAEDAKVYLTSALTIQQKVLGEEHTSTAYTLWMLGSVLTLLGDARQARACYEQALKIFALRLGGRTSAHPNG